MASALTWGLLNFVDGCMARGDLKSAHKIDVFRKRFFEKLPRFHILVQIVYSFPNEMRKAPETSHKRIHYRWEGSFVVVVTEISS